MRLNLLHLLDYVIQTYSMASVTQYIELKHDFDYTLYRFIAWPRLYVI